MNTSVTKKCAKVRKCASAQTTEKKNVYQIVTDRIMAELETGNIPWKKPWNSITVQPRNWKTGRKYHGINMFCMLPGEYATFKQVQEAGGTVKKGARASIVVFWKFLDVEEQKDDAGNITREKGTIPMLRYYSVFRVGEQTEGIEPKVKPETTRKHDPIPTCETMVKRYLENDGPALSHGGNRAFYQPASDSVTLPAPDTFISSEEYYSTLFHELGHSTGAEKRLARDFGGSFGTALYSREELVAEFTAAFLSAETGIDNDNLNGNAAAYIKGWLKVLKDDPKAAMYAAGRAQKAAKLIQGEAAEEEKEEAAA